MAHLTPAFSANHAAREYTEKHYLPAAAAAYCERGTNGGHLGADLLDWKQGKTGKNNCEKKEAR